MYKEAKFFLVFSLVIMLIMGYGVHAYMFAPQQPVGGTVLSSHGTDGIYEGVCIACHRDVEEWHYQTFTGFEVSDCMNCHGGASGTPHSVEGSYADCMSCHSGIKGSHDSMFGFPGTSYQDCLLCHIPE